MPETYDRPITRKDSVESDTSPPNRRMMADLQAKELPWQRSDGTLSEGISGFAGRSLSRKSGREPRSRTREIAERPRQPPLGPWVVSERVRQSNAGMMNLRPR